MSPLKRNIQIQSPSLTDLTPPPLHSNIRVNWTPPLTPPEDQNTFFELDCVRYDQTKPKTGITLL